MISWLLRKIRFGFQAHLFKINIRIYYLFADLLLMVSVLIGFKHWLAKFRADSVNNRWNKMMFSR